MPEQKCMVKSLGTDIKQCNNNHRKIRLKGLELERELYLCEEHINTLTRLTPANIDAIVSVK